MKWVLLLGVLGSLGVKASEYRITVDGDVFPSNAPDCLRELGLDDNRAILEAGRWKLILPKPGEYNFITSTNEPGRLFLSDEDEIRLVGISFDSEDGVEKQDLSDLSPDTMSSLLSVSVGGVPGAAVIELLSHIDPELTFVNVVEPYVIEDETEYPALRGDIRFLSSYSRRSSLKYLTGYSKLLYLDLDTGGKRVSCKYLTESSDLVYLDFNGEDIRSPKGLESLTSLRYLNLSYTQIKETGFLNELKALRFLYLNRCEIVDNLSFATGMPELKQLSLHDTKATDLQPLENLQFLEQVGVNGTGVNKLPRKVMPRLEWLRIMGAKLSHKDLATFQKLNPQCKVSSSWNQVFDLAMDGITRIRVRSGGTCHVDVAQEVTLFETSDGATIEALLDNIVVDEDNSGFHCMCCGEPTFEIYKGDELFASLGFHHGQSLRWDGGEWPGDAGLNIESADYLVAWLDQNGVSGPREEREYAEREARASEIAWAKWEKTMPECLKEYPEADGPIGRRKDDFEKMNLLLKSEFPHVNNRILALLEWYGSGRGPWSGYPSYESDAEKLLLLYSTMEILQSVNGIELSEKQTEGLARLLGGWRFYKQREGDRKLIPSDLRKQLLEHSLKTDDDDKKSRAQSAFAD